MKSMPWFRFYSETADDVKFKFLSRSLKMPVFSVVGIWAILECRASQSPRRGYLYVTSTKRFTIDDLADELNIDSVVCQSIMDAFIEMEMVDMQDGVIHLTNWEKRQYSSDNSTERVQKHRQKQSREGGGNVSETFHVTVPSVSVSVSESVLMSVISNSSGLSSIPPKEEARTEQLIKLLEKHGVENTQAALKKSCAEWVVTKNARGRLYPITNMGWVDWAQNALDGGQAVGQEQLIPDETGRVNL